MSARYEVCVQCGLRGRIVGSRGGRYGEQVTKVLARRAVWIAAEQGLVATGAEVEEMLRQIDESTLPQDQQDVDPNTRIFIAGWNIAQAYRWPKLDPEYIHTASRQVH